MPKLKPNKMEELARVFRACVSQSMELHGVTEDMLAKKVGVTKRTIQNRRTNPRTVTLEELNAMVDVLHLTPIQCAAILMGRPLTKKEVKDFIML